MTGAKYPHEQYYSGGACSRAPGAFFTHYIIGGVKYFRGDEGKCSHCNFTAKWEQNATGQKGSRVVEAIEKHLKHYENHGSCEEERKKEERKNEGVAGGGGASDAQED